jgi:hypothetical protein
MDEKTKSYRGALPRRRRGLGLLAALAIGALLFVGISIVATGGRGLGFTDSGFLRGPRAPDSSSIEDSDAPPPLGVPERGPDAPDLVTLRRNADSAQTDLENALKAGDPDRIQRARSALSRAQGELSEATTALDRAPR